MRRHTENEANETTTSTVHAVPITSGPTEEDLASLAARVERMREANENLEASLNGRRSTVEHHDANGSTSLDTRVKRMREANEALAASLDGGSWREVAPKRWRKVLP